MKFVVTGGAGFIGSHVAFRLASQGHEVVIYDNLSSGKLGNVDQIRVDLSADAGALDLVEGDILDGATLSAACDDSTAVFHHAAIASVPRSFAEPAQSARVNIEGTVQVLESARAAGTNTVVMASSSAIYGDEATMPVHEGLTPRPLSPYALSKAVDEQILELWTRTHGMRTAGLRYFNVYGPRQDPNSEYAAVIPKFITRMIAGRAPTIFGDGLQSRDFVSVDDVVAANLLAAGLDPATGQAKSEVDAPGFVAVNIGIGECYSLLDLVAALNEILGTAIEPDFEPARVGDVRDSRSAIDAAREHLGFVPQVSFREGLERTVQWYAN